MPRFSVVIPAYNAERTIGETIGSVLAQTAADLELIVVDDGSSDSTPELVAGIANADPRVRLVRQPNAGTAGARNTGIAEATAPYVSFVDNDDLWMPTYLESMGAALDADATAGFAYCDAYALDDATLRLRRRTELESRPPPPPGASRDEILVALGSANFVMSSATVRREVLTELGGFRTDVYGVDDLDLWFRILLAGHSAVRAATAPLLLQRDRPDSQSKDDSVMLAGLAMVLERVLADERLPGRARPAVEAQLAAVSRERAALAGGPSVSKVLRGTRESAVRIRDRVLDRRKFRPNAPPEVIAAFPQLDRSAGGGVPPA